MIRGDLLPAGHTMALSSNAQTHTAHAHNGPRPTLISCEFSFVQWAVAGLIEASLSTGHE